MEISVVLNSRVLFLRLLLGTGNCCAESWTKLTSAALPTAWSTAATKSTGVKRVGKC